MEPFGLVTPFTGIPIDLRKSAPPTMEVQVNGEWHDIASVPVCTDPTHIRVSHNTLAGSVKISDSGANDPLSSQQDDQQGKSGAFHPPRRRDAQGRLLRSYTTAAQKKSEQQWYRTHKLRRLTIPMPIDLIARLKAEAAVTHETFWKLVSRLLTDALDREQTVPLEGARSIEEMLP
jgi:hypothetical protein